MTPARTAPHSRSRAQGKITAPHSRSRAQGKITAPPSRSREQGEGTTRSKSANKGGSMNSCRPADSPSLLPRPQLRRVAGADHDGVPFVQKSCGKRLSGRPRTENADLQRLSHDLLLSQRMRAEILRSYGQGSRDGDSVWRHDLIDPLWQLEFDLHDDPPCSLRSDCGAVISPAPGLDSVAPSSPVSRPSPPGGPSQAPGQP